MFAEDGNDWRLSDKANPIWVDLYNLRLVQLN